MICASSWAVLIQQKLVTAEFCHEESGCTSSPRLCRAGLGDHGDMSPSLSDHVRNIYAIMKLSDDESIFLG